MRQGGIGLLVAGLMLLETGSVAVADNDGERGPVEVDGAVQVTADANPARGHVAPTMAVHPEDNEVLAIAEGDVTGGDCSVHVSVDRGLSWSQATVPDLPDQWSRCPYTNVGGIVDVTFGPEGTLYFALNGYDPEAQEGQVFLARSEDLGSSWSVTPLPRIERDLDQGEVGLDALPSVAVDPNDSDRVYVGWVSNWAAWTLRPLLQEAGQEYYWDVTFRPYVAASTDGGETFAEPVNAGEDLWITEDIEGMKSEPDLLVGDDGEVYVFFGESARVSEDGTREEPGEETAPASLYVARSDDGGESYSGETVYTEPDPTESSSFLWAPRAAIDRANDNLYVVWEQLSNAGQPVSIKVARSTDGGTTWSDATTVNDEEPPRKSTYMELFPSVSVAPSGRVDVAWYDPRNDPTYTPDEEDGDNAFHDVYYTYSDDEGETWASNVRITDRPIDRRVGPSATGDIQGPLDVVSLDEAAYIAWDDTRNAREEGQSQDIYFTRARHVSAEAFFTDGSGATRATGQPALNGAIGAGGALLVAGVLLLVASRRTRRGESQRERETDSPADGPGM